MASNSFQTIVFTEFRAQSFFDRSASLNECLFVIISNSGSKKSSNKLRMKALVGWNTIYQVPELINFVFFTRIKNDMDKEDKIAWN